MIFTSNILFWLTSMKIFMVLGFTFEIVRVSDK
jgi:hypothetical protein